MEGGFLDTVAWIYMSKCSAVFRQVSEIARFAAPIQQLCGTANKSLGSSARSRNICSEVRLYVCMYVCMHAVRYGYMYGDMYVCMYVCGEVRLYVCMYVCMYAVRYGYNP